MRTKTALVIVLTLLACGGAFIVDARDARGLPPKRYPKATPPPPPSPIYIPSTEKSQTAEEIEREAALHDDLLVQQIESALASGDFERRETAFTFLLPELIQVAPQRVVAVVGRQKPGEARTQLLAEVARQWISKDRDAALRWIASLDNETEKRDAAFAAVRTLASVAPDQAIYVADACGIGREKDGLVEQLVQGWAKENITSASRWVEAQPKGPRTDQLRAGVERARAQARRD